MRYFKCILEYDGTKYSGWQRQSNTHMTIQEKVEDALSAIAKQSVSVLAASRTDAGVHALGQVIGFSMVSGIPTDRVTLAMNSLLPKDIRVRSVEEVNTYFHPRFQAKGKIYHYLLDHQVVQSAFQHHYAYHVPYALDLDSMRQSAEYLVGTHDFSAFRAVGCSAKSPIRTIRRIEIMQDRNQIRLEFEGDGFLYNMVRILTGTLLYAGFHKFTPEEVKTTLEVRDRTLAGPTAPAHGLYLVKVFY